MKRITLCLPDGAAFWLQGYAAAQKISCSQAVVNLCMEQRTRFAEASEARKKRLRSPSPQPSPLEGEGA
jgi:hypothetical protein